MTQRTHIHVTPAAGKHVINPADFSALPESGARVHRNKYWLRRWREGVVECPELAAEQTHDGARLREVPAAEAKPAPKARKQKSGDAEGESK